MDNQSHTSTAIPYGGNWYLLDNQPRWFPKCFHMLNKFRDSLVSIFSATFRSSKILFILVYLSWWSVRIPHTIFGFFSSIWLCFSVRTSSWISMRNNHRYSYIQEITFLQKILILKYTSVRIFRFKIKLSESNVVQKSNDFYTWHGENTINTHTRIDIHLAHSFVRQLHARTWFIYIAFIHAQIDGVSFRDIRGHLRWYIL